MLEEVALIDETGGAYRARLRPGTPRDRTALVLAWVPMFRGGPKQWLDREWPWRTLGASDLHLDLNPELLVIADELEPGASGELFGVLVTTGPATRRQAGIDGLLELDGGLIWVEHIAIAPSVRSDCPARHQRRPRVRGIGAPLMRGAIARSKLLGLDGRIGLHAEGEVARKAYLNWDMRCLGEAAHRAGDTYPVYFGDAGWAARFCSGERTGGRR